MDDKLISMMEWHGYYDDLCRRAISESIEVDAKLVVSYPAEELFIKVSYEMFTIVSASDQGDDEKVFQYDVYSSESIKNIGIVLEMERDESEDRNKNSKRNMIGLERCRSIQRGDGGIIPEYILQDINKRYG